MKDQSFESLAHARLKPIFSSSGTRKYFATHAECQLKLSCKGN